ncbi:hypothetical protein ACOSP7_027299 [Xanthoceras sorbifolium]
MKSLHISVKFLGTRVEFDVDHPFTYTLVTFGPMCICMPVLPSDNQLKTFKGRDHDTCRPSPTLVLPDDYVGEGDISYEFVVDDMFGEGLPSDANDGGDEGHTSKDDKQADAHTTNGNYDDQQAERRTTDGGSDDQQVERHIQVMVMMINSK